MKSENKTPEEMWDAFIEAIHKDLKLDKETQVVSLIGGVKNFRKLFLKAAKEVND